MWADFDYFHARVGTRRELLREGAFMSLIERVEAFNQGSPFTLSRCSALGDGDVNLTSSVRQQLTEGRWTPEPLVLRVSFSAPANGERIWVGMRLTLDPAPMSELHFRLDPSFFRPDRLEHTTDFIRSFAVACEAEYVYLHHARDEKVQNTTDPNLYRSLTGQAPPNDPIQLENNPGRTLRVGHLVLEVAWMSVFGQTLLEAIGPARVRSAPGTVTSLNDNLLELRLYDDPFAFGSSESRALQQQVREHLHFDDLVVTHSGDLVDRTTTGEFETVMLPPSPIKTPAPAQDDTSSEMAPAAITPSPSEQLTSERLVDREVTPGRPNVDETDLEPANLDGHKTVRALRLPAPAWEASAWERNFLWAVRSDRDIRLADTSAQFYAARAQGRSRVLIVGSGPGQVATAALRAGLEVVVAVDEETLTAVRDALTREVDVQRERATLVSGDIESPSLAQLGPYDAVFLPDRAVNRLAGAHGLRRALQAARQLLPPNGVLIFNTFFPTVSHSETERLVPTLRTFSNPETKERLVLREAIRRDTLGQRLSITRRIDRLDDTGHVAEARYVDLDLHYYYPSELALLLEVTGFDAELFGDFDGGPLKSTRQEIVVVARPAG